MGYLGNQITTVFPTSISVDSATISGNTTVGGTLGVTGVSTLSDNIVFDASSKGIHLGVTSATASNLLDDYEEGTWTPSVGGNASYTTALGRYTKIGNHVLAQFDMTINVLGTGSVAAISGFPFTHENVMVASGSISFFSGVASNVYYLSFYVINNSTDAYLTGITSAGGTISNTLATFQNGARVNGMVSYRTA